MLTNELLQDIVRPENLQCTRARDVRAGGLTSENKHKQCSRTKSRTPDQTKNKHKRCSKTESWTPDQKRVAAENDLMFLCTVVKI